MKISELFERPIAHRGLHNDRYPENSTGAFENAVENRFPIETDLQLSKDGVVIVFHDALLNRMTDKRGFLRDYTANELNATKLKGGSGNYFIPGFKEFLELVNGRTPLLIELKSGKHNSELCKKTIELLKNYKGVFAIQSFNPLILNYFRKNAPEIPRGRLTASIFEGEIKLYEKTVVKRLFLNRGAKPDFIVYDYKDKLTHKCARLKQRGMNMIAYTVRDQKTMDELFLNDCCDNVIFDGFVPV